MAKKELYDEQELLQLIARGDERAFSVIVARYTSVIYTHLLIYLKNAPRAEEAAQDIFMSIWRNREKLAGMENFPGYVYVITRNRVQTIIKEKLLSTVTAPEDRLQTILASPVAGIQFKELQEAIGQGIALLPPRRKEVFKLSRLENRSYDEIASQLGISRNAVKQHITESLAFLRHYLKKEMDVIILGLLWFSVTGT